MAEIVNLRRARKAKARAADAARAAENRVRFGQPKAVRARADAEDKLATQRLEGHRREPPGEA